MGEQDGGDFFEGLEDRLKSHAAAFESLLALTPARDYYGAQIVDGQEPSEQWNRKKQTKEQKRAAKKAKLMPENNKSALDIVKEREAEALKGRKRKRGGDGDDEVGETNEDQGVKKVKKAEGDGDAAEAKRREKAERRKEKRLRKKEKGERKKAKAEAKKERKQEQDLADAEAERDVDMLENLSGSEAEGVEDAEVLGRFEMDDLADSDVGEQDEEIGDDDDDAASHHSSAPTTPLLDSPAFDLATDHSAASSSSSIIPPSTVDRLSRPSQSKHQPAVKQPTLTTQPPTTTSDDLDGAMSPKVHFPEIDSGILQSRLRFRIEAMRDARKANENAKNRNALLDSRRAKEERRKAARKEQWAKEKEEEAREREEQLRGSRSPLVGDVFEARPKQDSYAFSRLAFEDGTTADAELTGLQQPSKKRGPSDPKTALKAAQAKESRLAGYDSTKQSSIKEKDTWIDARTRAQGQRTRDDTSMLKKALKHKEKAKGKSEQQWKERQEGIVKGREMKQKKREKNLLKRKEEKGGKGKKGKGGARGGSKVGGGKAGGAKGGVKKGKGKRPGFEGRFKA